MNLCKCGCDQEVTKEGNRFIRGHNNNQKGLKRSEEFKESVSKIHKGKKLSEETKIKISKGNKGKKLSEESVRKLSISHKGKKHSEETKIKMSNTHTGKRHSEETKKKISFNHADFSRENAPNWQGGISFEPYCSKFNKELKEQVRDKFNRKCFNCNKDEKDNINKLSIHHVYYDKMEGCNNREFTLIPLCISCHARTNFNRNHWREYFIKKL